MKIGILNLNNSFIHNPIKELRMLLYNLMIEYIKNLE